VQGAALELHGWQATTDELERPDQIVMDLDPGEGVELPAIVAAAREVRARLEAAGLASFVKTTGGKGLHVVAPLVPKAGWAEVKGFAKAVADAMAADEPERYVATMSKAKRRGRILVDYLRNGRGRRRWRPTRRGRARGRRCRCRSTGASSTGGSGPPTSRWRTRRGGWRGSSATPGRISGRRRRRWGRKASAAKRA
jgi:DNA ligase D-like protein (predicted polymerase)